MVRSAADQKAYRDQQRALLGDVEYKAQQALQRKERRARNKIPKEEVIADPACVALEDLLVKAGLTEKTAQAYIFKTTKVYKLLHNEAWNCSDFNWLQDHKTVIGFINNGVVPEWKTRATRSTYLNHVAALVRHIPELQDVTQFYTAAKNAANSDMDDQRVKQELKPAWKDKIIPWLDLVEINKVANFKTTFDEAVYGIFTLVPPRRSGSFYDLQIRPLEYESKTKNYITVDDEGVPKEIVLNRYKTSKQYGEFRIKIPVPLRKKIQWHIAGGDIGDYVFNNQITKDPYKNQEVFSTAVVNVFKKYTDKSIGSTLLRISYASYIVFNKKASLDPEQAC